MTAPKDIDVLAQTTVTTSGQGASADNGPNRELCKLVVEVSAIDVGQLQLFVETGLAQTGWNVIATLAPVTSAGSYALTVVGGKERIRVRYVLTEDPQSVTLAVTGTSQQLYCHPDNVLNMSVPGAALATLATELLAEACLAATDEAASYLGKSQDLPLVSWGYALRMHVSNMAAYHALMRRGYSPEADPTIRQAYLDALAWLQSYAASDPAIEDSSPTVGSVSAFWVSDPPRGWQRDP